jgi:hypothetical protein
MRQGVLASLEHGSSSCGTSHVPGCPVIPMKRIGRIVIGRAVRSDGL